MKWYRFAYKDGDIRSRRIFLFFPVKVTHDRKSETRWLEWAIVKEQYHIGFWGPHWWEIFAFEEEVPNVTFPAP